MNKKIKLWTDYYLKKENLIEIIPAINYKLFGVNNIIKYLFFKLKKEYIIKIYNNQKMIISSEDKGLSFELYCNKIREKIATKEFLKILNKEDIVFDLGANFGYFVIQEAKIVKQVIAVEPIKINYSYLKKNIKLNNLKNVDTYNIAIGNKNGNTHFYETESKNVSSAIKPKNKKYKKINLKMRKGDSFLKEIKVYPNVLRMDVEGYELEILKSIKKNLTQFNKIFIEVHNNILKDKDIKEFYKILQKNNFNEIIIIKDYKKNIKKNKKYIFKIQEFIKTKSYKKIGIHHIIAKKD